MFKGKNYWPSASLKIFESPDQEFVVNTLQFMKVFDFLPVF